MENVSPFSGMLVFTPDQLFTLNHSRPPPSRPTRKTSFALKLWRPSRDRDKSRVSRGRSNVDNVNKQHVQTSPWRVGWLNARSPQAPSMKRSTTDVSMFLP